MAVGDIAADGASVAAGNYLDIRPGAGVEWVIHNIYYATDVKVHRYKSDASVDIAFANRSGGGVFSDYFFHCSNTWYLRVENNTASAQDIAFDGVVTKA